MIDIETLDTGPRSVVLAIGAVVFDPFTGEVGDPYFYASLPIQEQIDQGRTISEHTLTWWTDPERDEAWQRMVANRSGDVDHALESLSRFFQQYVPKGAKVWANSPSFDCVILDTLFKEYYIDLPWSFRDQMDVRTWANISYDEDEVRPNTAFGLAHDPVHDCVSQINLVAACYEKLTADAKTFFGGGADLTALLK